jgi:CubicO group peptidase (beta-lactamase class C family)
MLRPFLIFIAFILILSAAPATGEQLPPLSAILDIDFLMEHAASHGLIAGGVVLVGTRTGILFERAYGRMSSDPAAPAMRMDTIFDIASLTKVVATTAAIMKLAEEDKLLLVDPVATWFPEFGSDYRKDLQIMHLLTHTSGIEDFPLAATDSLRYAVERCAARPVKGEIGNTFCYTDLNFILLGELVRRASGVTLDRYAAERFYAPLGMTDTFFTPPLAVKTRLSATVLPDGSLLTGAPQDYHARLLGGVAGHAGLFSTAADLACFCRMLMNGGEFDGRRVLSERSVAQMTAPHFSSGGKVVRGLGWDIASPYSAPRGRGFSEFSFGHTGYSGMSIWIDPERDIFVVLLTARLDYRRVGEFNRLRRDLSTIAAAFLARAGRTSPPVELF